MSETKIEQASGQAGATLLHKRGGVCFIRHSDDVILELICNMSKSSIDERESHDVGKETQLVSPRFCQSLIVDVLERDLTDDAQPDLDRHALEHYETEASVYDVKNVSTGVRMLDLDRAGESGSPACRLCFFTLL